MARLVKHPTELELEILKCLWEQGPLSGKEVRDALASTRELTYQSVMTVLEIMEDKGFVKRKKEGGNSVPALVIEGQVFHINHDADLSLLK